MKLADPGLDHGLAFLRGLVFGVLFKIAEFTRMLNIFRKLVVQLVLKLLNFVLKFLFYCFHFFYFTGISFGDANVMPISLADRTSWPSGDTVFRFAQASANGTVITVPACSATIFPVSPAASARTAQAPKFVASIRSNAFGLPPR